MDHLIPARAKHLSAQAYRDGIALAMAEVVTEGHVPSERMVDEFRIAVIAEQMAFDELTCRMAHPAAAGDAR